MGWVEDGEGSSVEGRLALRCQARGVGLSLRGRKTSAAAKALEADCTEGETTEAGL